MQCLSRVQESDTSGFSDSAEIDSYIMKGEYNYDDAQYFQRELI